LETTLEVIQGHSQLSMLGTVHVPIIESGIIEKLDKLAKEARIVGIKLYPGFELFYPNDERCHAIYDVCINNNIPVVFHSGETKGEKWREKYNHPDEIAKVTQKYKDLNIVIAHFSQPHLDACKEVVLEHNNAYADLSGLAHPDVLKVCGGKEIKRILKLVAKQNPEKILFGTDWPICDIGEHLKLVNSLDISDYNKAMILASNAEKVFPISNSV